MNAGHARIDEAHRPFDSAQPDPIDALLSDSPPTIESDAVDQGPSIELGSTKSILDWKVSTLVDAYDDRGPIEYVIKGLFRVPSVNLVYGPPGCLKSMLLADVCGCVVQGTPWLPGLDSAPMPGFATLHAPVLWIDLDNGEHLTHERFAAIGRGHSLPPSACRDRV